MRLKKSDNSIPQVIIIPMIDIMFFLLVFFMLSTMHMSNISTVPVNLTVMKEVKLTETTGLVVTVNDKGEIFLGESKIKRDTLQERFQIAVKDNPDLLVILRIDRESRYNETSEILDCLHYAGVKKIALVGEKGSSYAEREK